MFDWLIWRLAGNLHRAAQLNEIDRMRAYIAKGADVNAADRIGVTPLFYTANDGSVEAARLLLQHGADILHTVPGGGTVLHSALLKEHEDLALFFIDQGADVNQATVAGVTPLHMAAQSGLRAVAARLLKRGADVNALTAKEQSPLFLAIVGMSLPTAEVDAELIRMLFAAGAAPKLDVPEETNILVYAWSKPELWKLVRDEMLAYAERVGEDERSYISSLLEAMENPADEDTEEPEDEDDASDDMDTALDDADPVYAELMDRAEALGSEPFTMPINIFSLSRAFAEAPDPEVTAALMDTHLSRHESKFVRRAAYTAIRYMGPRTYIAADIPAMILRGLDDPDDWVRYDAVWAGDVLGLDSPEFRAGLLRISGGVSPESIGEVSSSDATANATKRAAKLLATLADAKP